VLSMATKRRWSARVMRTSGALDLEQGVFAKSTPRAIARSLKPLGDVDARLPPQPLSERGRKSERVAKRRVRSLKRDTGGGAPATQTRSGWGAQGQRRAMRGTRTRQRRT